MKNFIFHVERFAISKILLLLLIASSCSPDLPECPNKMCLLSGGWALTEVYVDGVIDNSDISLYRLVLTEPGANAASSIFNRTQPSGAQDNGAWSTQNNDQVLQLIPNNDPLLTEDYVIESFTLRELVLVINRASNKTGPEQIKFILEPF